MKSIFAALATLLTLNACGLKKTADGMRRDLAQVRAQTGNLANRGEDATADLSYAVSYQVLVLGNLDKIFGEAEPFYSGWIGSTPKDPDILFYATSAIDAMWFQTWRARADAGEGLHSLDVRLKTGLEILLGITYKHAPWDGDVNVSIPDRSFKGLASLAANLDRVRPEFADAWARTGRGGDVSLYHVMRDALATRDQIDADTPFPAARAMVLRRPESVAYLLQLRHNYLPVLALSLMNGFGSAPVATQVARTVVGQTMDMSSTNAAQIAEWSGLLRAARETRADLRAMGIEPKYNDTLSTIARSIEPSMTADSVGREPSPAARRRGGAGVRASNSNSPLAKMRRAFAREYLETLPPREK